MRSDGVWGRWRTQHSSTPLPNLRFSQAPEAGINSQRIRLSGKLQIFHCVGVTDVADHAADHLEVVGQIA